MQRKKGKGALWVIVRACEVLWRESPVKPLTVFYKYAIINWILGKIVEKVFGLYQTDESLIIFHRLIIVFKEGVMRLLLQETTAYKLLRSERDKNRLHHAYLLLLDDARNLGFALKTFAKVLFSCETEGAGTRRISALIDEGKFADCHEYPKTDKKFTVAEAERVLEEISLKPVEGDKKVFIVSDFAEATPQAQNKLLKILEEPPEGVFFLIGATVVYPILQTVLSRTEKLEILPFDVGQVTDCLVRLYEHDERFTSRDLSLCGAASGGSVGNAQNVLEGGYYRQLTQSAFDLALSTPFQLPVNVKKIAEIKYKKEFLSLLRLIFRDALIVKTTQINGVSPFGKMSKRAEKYLLLRSEKENVERVSKTYNLNALLFAQEAISAAEKEIFFNAAFSQCMQLLMSKIMIKDLS